jgi:Ca2+-binding EF-hand superfamily protein
VGIDERQHCNELGEATFTKTCNIDETVATSIDHAAIDPMQTHEEIMPEAVVPGHAVGWSGWAILRKMTELVDGPHFEGFFALLILSNIFMMAAESQYLGMKSGYNVGYWGVDRPADETWPNAEFVFAVVENIFGSLFTLELVLKIIFIRKKFLGDVWNLIDTIIVVSWLFTTLGTTSLPIDPMLLRLARLARLLRVLRLVRTIRLFDSLYLMTTSMKGSLSVLLWSVVLLALVQMMISFLLQSLLMSYINDVEVALPKRVQVFKYYGSFARTMLTMFEITLGNWMPPCRALVENVSEWYMLFFLCHKLIIGFSVVSVIGAVFIQETFKVATTDDRIMVMTKERARKTHAAKMLSLFDKMDVDNDGGISLQELDDMLADTEVKTRLSATMDLDVRDCSGFFALLDKDGDGMISFEELSDGVSRLKGMARSYDVASLHHTTSEVKKLVREVKERLDGRTYAPCEDELTMKAGTLYR